MLFLPRTCVEIHDVWQALGLRGTGSNDYSIHDMFVPEAMVVSQTAMMLPPDRGYPVAYYDFGPFTSASTMLGLARASIGRFKTSGSSRVRSAASTAISTSHITQDIVGRAEIAYVQAALLLLHAADEVSWPRPSDAERQRLSALVRLSAASVADSCRRIVADMYRVAGSAAVYEHMALERHFRDAHTADKHITLSPTNFEMVGQFLLGGPLAMRR